MEPLKRLVKPGKAAKQEGAAYLAPYEVAARKHGASFEATLWASRTSQLERFRVMTEMVEMRGRVVVDAGSGCGAMAEYLRDQAIGPARYIGLEGVASVVEGAKTRDIPGAEVILADFVADKEVFTRLAPDVIVFSGSLNTIGHRDTLAVLDRAWTALQNAPCLAQALPAALVFNFLSDRCDESLARQDPSPARRFDTMAMLDWAMDRCTATRFRQDYLPNGHDATIAMFRRP